MKDYASMSDFEINKRVADIAMNGTWHVKPNHPDNDSGGWLYGSNGIKTHELPDYCNNPADAWQIITGSMISIRPVGNDGQLWEAAGMDGMKADYDKNPLRAAMVVFLMMKEGEK